MILDWWCTVEDGQWLVYRIIPWVTELLMSCDYSGSKVVVLSSIIVVFYRAKLVGILMVVVDK